MQRSSPAGGATGVSRDRRRPGESAELKTASGIRGMKAAAIVCILAAWLLLGDYLLAVPFITPKTNIVVESNFLPGRSSVDGKFG